MTIITKGTTVYRVKATDNTTELSETLGYDIVYKEFLLGEFLGGKVRGYVVIALPGIGTIQRGPVTLNNDDIETVTYY
ncbi:MAG: hypothetical protein E6Q97_00305 [Desulfurellales bacterium]|nr:MAG: hypothetical protein E6Q97_00305 [Desulfurellales bacterium]